MRRIVAFLLPLIVVPLSISRAQHPFPVTVGLGGGVVNGSHHGMLVVGITAPRSPVSLRLDGLITPARGRVNTDFFSALSASAVVSLRPWRVAPYLVVGATRTNEFAVRSLDGQSYRQVPASTELSGGAGLSMRWRRATIFTEARTLQRAGSPITFGISF